MPAHARGEGREVRERERQKRQKSLQINGIVLAAPGVGMVWGRGPSREERGGGKWHELRETRERHGPPPHSDNPRRHSLPSPWADIPALKPPWARRPPLPEKSHKEMLLRDFLMVNTSPPNTGDSPHLGKKWLQGAALWREWYPRAPRRKDNSEMLSLIPSAAGQTLPSERWGSETSLPESFRDNSCLEREPAQD